LSKKINDEKHGSNKQQIKIWIRRLEWARGLMAIPCHFAIPTVAQSIGGSSQSADQKKRGGGLSWLTW
jgi:hypothetical protein